MTYEAAIKAARRTGYSKCEGLPHLALTLATLARAHAINPKLAYEGACKRGFTAADVRRMSPLELGDLMFVGATP